MKYIVSTLLLLLFGCAESHDVKILAIGNSFTDNSVHYIEDISQIDGRYKFDIEYALMGSGSLKDHVEAIDEKCAYSWRGQSCTNLRILLKRQHWDFITIQQVSFQSTDFSTFEPYATKLISFIRSIRPDSEIVINETWAYRSDFFFPEKSDQKKMYHELKNAYSLLSEKHNLRIIPVGTGFQIMREKLPFVALNESASDQQKLREQENSLIKGYYVENNILKFDGHHANQNGSFLASLIWYKFFSGKHEDILKGDISFINRKNIELFDQVSTEALKN